MGRTVLQTINALDSGSQLPAPSAYLIYHKNVIPAWAVRLLVLALIVPVLMTTVDGLARVRRRGHRIGRRLLWVLSGAVPFLLAAAIAYLAGLVAVLDVVPAGPVGQNDVPLHGRGTALLIVMAVVVVGSLFAVRRLLPLGRRPQAAPRAARGRRDGADDPIPGAVAALLLVMCVVSIAIWVGNPFAAALTVPALHLWLWGLAPDVPLPRPARLAMVVVGVLPGVFVLLYYAVGLGYSPLGLAWTVALMVAGGQVGAAAVLAWSLLLGCAVAASTIAVRLRRDEPAAAELRAVTVRGPVTYAGPGSLGGTESALRR
jgi:hypothetical protein